MVTVSAPGKLMLMGEHAVVYGKPCIVTAVDRRLTVTAETSDDGKITINAPQVKETKFVDAAIAKFFETVGKGIAKKGTTLRIQSEFTHNVGFGSSSAVSVATLKALGVIFDTPLPNRQIFDLAYQVTLDIQGVGSGFDVAAATYGGTLSFTKGGSKMTPLPNHVPLVVGYSGVKADTPALIREVARKHQQSGEKVDRIFRAIGKLVAQGEEAIKEQDWERLGKLMDFNQEYLRDLGVSTGKLEDLISAAKKAGSLGAKLSGAGGGDCMIALYADGAQGKPAVIKAIQEAGGEVIDVAPNAQGVRIETTDDQGELFVVVDKNDKILDYRTRYECHRDKSLIHRTVGAVIFDDRRRVLLQKRSSTKDMGAGLWGISCAGHVRKGQEYEEALHRELVEELGVDMPIEYVTKFIVADQDETELSALYKGTFNGPFTFNQEEVERVEFFSPRELAFKLATREVVLTKCAEISLQKIGIIQH